MDKSDRQSREAMHGGEYVKRFSANRQIARVARLVERIHLPSNAKIMDVGCGTGILAKLLAPYYDSYTGIDFSDAMLQQAQADASTHGLDRCQFFRADAAEVMREQAGMWDAVFMLDISEHIPDSDMTRIVGAAHHALKYGGKVYLHTPNLSFFLELLKQHGILRQLPEHIAVRDAAQNVRFFKHSNYSRVTYRYLPHYNALRWLHPLSRLPFVGKYFAARIWIVATK